MNEIDFINVDQPSFIEEQAYVLKESGECSNNSSSTKFEFLDNYVNLTVSGEENNPNCFNIIFEFSGNEGSVTKISGNFEREEFTTEREGEKFMWNNIYKVKGLKLNDEDLNFITSQNT